MSVDLNKSYTSDGKRVVDLTPIWGGHFIGRREEDDTLLRWNARGHRVTRCSGDAFFQRQDDLVAADPVRYYFATYQRYSQAFAGGGDIAWQNYSNHKFNHHPRSTGPLVRLVAMHASGKMRDIAIDATSDPEGGAP